MKKSPLRPTHYATCLWPGLAELWWRGRLSSLPTAIVFAIVLNLLLVARFFYPQWLGGGPVVLAFWIGAAVWGYWVVRAGRALPAMLVPRIVSARPDRFPEAQAAYLAGDWGVAERLLADVLSIEPRDPPALLLLCGVYRHLGRLDAAEVLLTEVERLEAADGWWLEVRAEKNRLQRDREAPIPSPAVTIAAA